MNNSKEVVKKIKSIFEEMQIIRYNCHIDSLIRRGEEIYDYDNIRYSCYIDSLIRIDEEMYDCDNCLLADTLDVKRDDVLGREICPLEVKGDIYALRWWWIIKK